MIKIIVLPDLQSHYMTGYVPGIQGCRFRPYTVEELTVCINLEKGLGKGLSQQQLKRITEYPEEPGDVVIDLGNEELNHRFIDLLNEAIGFKPQCN